MDQRRFVLFLSLSLGFMLLWSNFVLPRFAPPKPIPVADFEPEPDENGAPDAAAAAENDANAGFDADSVKAENDDQQGDKQGDENASGDQPAKGGDAQDDNAEVDSVTKLAEAEPRTVTLGERNSKSGYFIEVEFTSLGAGINAVWLTHPKFAELDDRTQQLQLLGDSRSEFKTLATRLGTVVEAGKPQTFLQHVHWAVADSDANSVTFETTMPGGVVARKTYGISKLGPKSVEWYSLPMGYRIDCELTFRNPGDKPAKVAYHVQGPVGIRLENKEHTRKFRDVKIGFFKDNGSTKLETMTSSEIYKQFQAQVEEARADGLLLDPAEINRKLESWHNAFKYIAVDVQFFAAILAPLDERELDMQIGQPWCNVARPMLVNGNPKNPSWSDISFQLDSLPLEVPPGGEVTHKYAFYTGPKRESLVGEEPFAASDILDHGSIVGPIARAMLSLLRFFHRLGLPYALCIICMTLLVRACMYPLSRKQAMGAKKMKELQPKLTELKAKYGDDKEKMARAQMELFRKNNYNPFAGCLPIFFQFPIFIGLYTSLNVAVDLRMAPFLWCDNLAAPDKLFRMPFELPFLGSDFNLLPLVTCVLFIVQQKMFMPPPTDEQQALQQKMMSYMTIMFGFMFWHVPAGLCVYFIASSLWGLAERKLLDFKKSEDVITDISLDEPKAGKSGNNKPGKNKLGTKKAAADPNAKKGFFSRLTAAAEEASRQAQSAKRQDTRKSKKKKR